MIKKKSVRGLLRKRAKQYESASESDSQEEGKDRFSASHLKKKVQKSTMAAAFSSIMNKKLQSEDAIITNTTIDEKEQDMTLVKYKKKARDVDEKTAKEEAE